MSQQVEAGAKDAWHPLLEQMRLAKAAAVAEAKALPGDISRALIQGQADVESGMEALTDLMKDSLSDAAKIAYYKGVLASRQLAKGLRDERADVRSAAQQVRDDALAQLKLLESGVADAMVDTRTTSDYQWGLLSDEATAAAQALRLRCRR